MNDRKLCSLLHGFSAAFSGLGAYCRFQMGQPWAVCAMIAALNFGCMLMYRKLAKEGR